MKVNKLTSLLGGVLLFTVNSAGATDDIYPKSWPKTMGNWSISVKSGIVLDNPLITIELSNDKKSRDNSLKLRCENNELSAILFMNNKKMVTADSSISLNMKWGEEDEEETDWLIDFKSAGSQIYSDDLSAFMKKLLSHEQLTINYEFRDEKVSAKYSLEGIKDAAPILKQYCDW